MHPEPNRPLARDVARPEDVRAYGVMNTLRALELLVAAPRSAPELAGLLAISVRTARRLLRRLAAEGYAVQDAGHRRRYRPTLRVIALAAHLLDGAVLPPLGSRCVSALSAATGTDAHLWIWADGRSAVCVAHATPAPRAGVASEPATGAAIAVLSPGRARQRSSAFVAGVDCAAAAAVLDRGRVVAALGVTGDVRLEQLAVVAQQADRLTRELALAVTPTGPA